MVEDRVPAEIEEMPQFVEGIRACSSPVHGLALVSYLSRSADLYHRFPRVVCFANVAVDMLALSPLSLTLSLPSAPPTCIDLLSALFFPTAVSFSVSRLHAL